MAGAPLRGTPTSPALLVRCVGAALVFVLALPVAAQTEAPPLEDQVKAAFLYNFAKFTTWPANPTRRSDDPFVIAVVGDDAFVEALEIAVRHKTVEGHAFQVRRVRSAEEMGRCQMAYLAGADAER